QGIYFIGDVGNFSIDPVQGADIDTFYVLSDKYAVDANHVYFGKYSIPGADPKTFEVIKSYLSGPIAERKVEINDEPTVENGGASENEQLYELALTNDVNGYYLYAKDKVHVYYLSPELDDYGSNENIPSPISAADPETFVLLSDDYSKDSQHVYFDGQVIGDADPSSFVLAAGSLNQFDARDKNHIYLDGQVVQ
ncbi:MAG TPA: DKNYY domain-containing protein, partial [Candidatus Paceibacterota bacterium]|nr:DKNYY domain-containing protein [Candidatus Paceibacterota bacterium]